MLKKTNHNKFIYSLIRRGTVRRSCEAGVLIGYISDLCVFLLLWVFLEFSDFFQT